jgi:protein-disulfide isomerase
MARVLFVLMLGLLAFTAPPATAQSFNAQEQAEIRAIVREYLVRNPDVLREAITSLNAREDAENRHKAETDPRDFAMGPADAPITVVEFFDYRCPYCQAALPWVVQTLRTRRDVRFIFKEMPLEMHGRPALEASQASVAAMQQGRYFQFHQALMSFTGDLTSARIDQLARQSGIDVTRMRRGMGDQAISQLIRDNTSLASTLGVTGTPAFLINGQLVAGFDPERLDAALREAGRTARTREAQR